MANARRGEINAVLDNRSYTLCLTLGALAELEDAFEVHHLMALANRFQEGKLSANDLAIILGCGLRGAGHDIPNQSVMAMKSEDGVAGFIDIVNRLLIATFGEPAADENAKPTSVEGQNAKPTKAEGQNANP